MRIRKDPKRGRGVYADHDFHRDQIIEESPVIVIPAAEAGFITASTIGQYCYDWGDGELALGLGCASLYNHEAKPNASYEMDYEHDTIILTAIVDITEGEEITICYAEYPDDLWFDTEAAVQD